MPDGKLSKKKSSFLLEDEHIAKRGLVWGKLMQKYSTPDMKEQPDYDLDELFDDCHLADDDGGLSDASDVEETDDDASDSSDTEELKETIQLEKEQRMEEWKKNGFKDIVQNDRQLFNVKTIERWLNNHLNEAKNKVIQQSEIRATREKGDKAEDYHHQQMIVAGRGDKDCDVSYTQSSYKCKQGNTSVTISQNITYAITNDGKLGEEQRMSFAIPRLPFRFAKPVKGRASRAKTKALSGMANNNEVACRKLKARNVAKSSRKAKPIEEDSESDDDKPLKKNDFVDLAAGASSIGEEKSVAVTLESSKATEKGREKRVVPLAESPPKSIGLQKKSGPPADQRQQKRGNMSNTDDNLAGKCPPTNPDITITISSESEVDTSYDDDDPLLTIGGGK